MDICRDLEGQDEIRIFRLVILLDYVHPQMRSSLEAVTCADIKRNQIDSSKVKKKRVSYLQTEILKRIIYGLYLSSKVFLLYMTRAAARVDDLV